MSELFIFILLLVSTEISAGDIQEVNLLEENPYTWDGYNLGNTVIKVTADNFYISVTIDSCDIGQSDSRPNNEYLTLKQGRDDITTTDGRIFAYIKNPIKLYFFYSSVILELKTPTQLKNTCKVIFEKGDVEDTTLPPVTTTETTPTWGPDVSKYATVLITGKSIDEYSSNKDLVLKLRNDIVGMATEYTTTEEFCLKKKIEPEDVDITVFEQCSSKYPNFETCVRIVYALPVKIDEDCSLWKGYQLNQEHLDIMWSRLSDKYLEDGLRSYEEPSVNSIVMWWIIAIVFATLLIVAVMIYLNLAWRKREVLRRARATRNEDFIPEIRRVSDLSLTPPYFQSIPPMFDKSRGTKISNSEESQGTSNEGFEYDEIPDCEENGTVI